MSQSFELCTKNSKETSLRGFYFRKTSSVYTHSVW